MGSACSKTSEKKEVYFTPEEVKFLEELDGKVRTLYPIVGEREGCRALAQAFYDKVWDDTENEAFQMSTAFATETKESAVDKLTPFIVESLGGPDDYSATRHSLLKFNRSKHLLWRYLFTTENINRWLYHMHAVIDETGLDEEPKQILRDYFKVGIDRIMESEAKFDAHNQSMCPHGKLWVV